MIFPLFYSEEASGFKRVIFSELSMKKIYKPIYIKIDNEESDVGFFSLAFIFNFNNKGIPHYLVMCRDFFENRDALYLEVDDQIYGFSTKNINYHVDDSILKLMLTDEKEFYWDGSKFIFIEISKDKIAQVCSCLESVFSGF